MWGRRRLSGLVFQQFSRHQPAGRWGTAFPIHHPLPRPWGSAVGWRLGWCSVLVHWLGAASTVARGSSSHRVPGPPQHSSSQLCPWWQDAPYTKRVSGKSFLQFSAGLGGEREIQPTPDSAEALSSCRELKYVKKSATQTINPLSWGKPYPPGGKDEKYDPGSSQLPSLDPKQRPWEVNQKAFTVCWGPWFGLLQSTAVSALAPQPMNSQAACLGWGFPASQLDLSFPPCPRSFAGTSRHFQCWLVIATSRKHTDWTRPCHLPGCYQVGGQQNWLSHLWK